MNVQILKLKLEEINRSIDYNYPNVTQLGVHSGLSGLALFKFYYAKYLDSNKPLAVGEDILEHSMNQINDGYSFPTFCTGLAGYTWVLDHLATEKFIDIENDDLLSNFDDSLSKVMIFNLDNGNYDFLHGAIGYALYFLNRYRNTNSKELREKYKQILLEFIFKLDQLSEIDSENMLKWASILAKSNVEVYNLSLSHGMSSIVGILTKLHQYDDFKSSTKEMLEGAINYILSFKRKKGFSLFPNYIPKTGEFEYLGRIAWCYGDLGIGLRLWFAAKVLQDKTLEDDACDILLHAATRRITKKSLVVDAGICHGSFGNAQIFSRMYKETKNQIFNEARGYWMQDGINKALHENGMAGYKQWDAIKGEWRGDVSLIEGISGIGLTIIDYLADFETTWDECLMIS